MWFFIPCLVFVFFLHSEEPWGKDADMYVKPVVIVCDKSCSTPFLGSLGEVLIGFHQQVISPADGPRSHFLPSSSQYTLEAMRSYGFFKGFIMGCDRLMRENSDPWIYSTTSCAQGPKLKLDPVP